jgi:glutathione S-transferase
VLPLRHPAGGEPFSFPNVAAELKRMQQRPSVKKLLAYEKEVNEGFTKTA